MSGVEMGTVERGVSARCAYACTFPSFNSFLTENTYTRTECNQRWMDLIWHAEPWLSKERADSVVQAVVLHALSCILCVYDMAQSRSV
jgi:hypothetical protein